MDPGFRSPLIDFFRRGEVASDVRMLAARGALAPRALEQLALLIVLEADADPAIAAAAAGTLETLPRLALSRFLGRSDVPEPMRRFFLTRGIEPGPVVEIGGDEAPIVETDADLPDDVRTTDPQTLSALPVIDRMKLAMRGTREQRAQLIRDSNRLIAVAVLSSPKLTESEVEAFARMANLAEDVLRIIAMNRAWTKNYNVIASLTKNPKTPPALAMKFLQRLSDRDLKMISIDRNVSEPVRLAARKFVVKGMQ